MITIMCMLNTQYTTFSKIGSRSSSTTCFTVFKPESSSFQDVDVWTYIDDINFYLCTHCTICTCYTVLPEVAVAISGDKGNPWTHLKCYELYPYY